jgi:hypothetical protein
MPALEPGDEIYFVPALNNPEEPDDLGEPPAQAPNLDVPEPQHEPMGPVEPIYVDMTGDDPVRPSLQDFIVPVTVGLIFFLVASQL